MSKWDKLIDKIYSYSKDIRFDELRKILLFYGYEEHTPKGGSSHHVFRKKGRTSITIPCNNPIKATYVKLVKEVLDKEGNNGESN